MFRFIILALTFLTFTTHAQTNSLLKSGDWEAGFNNTTNSCFTMSIPIETQGNVNRSPAYFIISFFNNNSRKPEISFFSGFKTNSQNFEVSIDSLGTYYLKTDGTGWGWPRPEDDNSILQNLQKGWNMQIKSYASDGTAILDVISLRGTTKTIEAAKRQCNNL